MYPQLLQLTIGDTILPIKTYYLCLILGVIFGSYIIFKVLRREESFSRFQAAFYISVGVLLSIAGARIFHFIIVDPQNVSLFDFSPAELAKGGFSIAGAIILPTLILSLYHSYRRQKLFRIADNITPGIAIGFAFARLGCFFNGCCYGIPTSKLFGISFPENSQAYSSQLRIGLIGLFHQKSLPVWPTQLIEIGFWLSVFALTIKFKRINSFLISMIAYCLFRIIIDFYRDDRSDILLWGFSTNQIIFLTAIPFLVVVLFYKSGKFIPSRSS